MENLNFNVVYPEIQKFSEQIHTNTYFLLYSFLSTIAAYIVVFLIIYLFFSNAESFSEFLNDNKTITKKGFTFGWISFVMGVIIFFTINVIHVEEIKNSNAFVEANISSLKECYFLKNVLGNFDMSKLPKDQFVSFYKTAKWFKNNC